MDRDHSDVDAAIVDLSERMVRVEVGITALNDKFDSGIANLNDKVDTREAYQRERNHEILNSIADADARGQKRGMEQTAALEKLHQRITEKKNADVNLQLTYGLRALMFLGTIVLTLIGFIYLNDVGRAR